MLKQTIYNLLDKAMDLPFVRDYLKDYMYRKPKLCIKSIRRYNDIFAQFHKIPKWPEDISSFEKLSFLFHSSQANYGLCLMAFDEASYLYQLASTIRRGRIAEIGRFKGGGTFLIAAAMGESSVLDSFDNHREVYLYRGQKRKVKADSVFFDQQLLDALKRYSLEPRVHLYVKDSKEAFPDQESYELVFIDGDHSYEAANGDFNHWYPAVKPGGHLVFHDAGRERRYSSSKADVVRLIAEIEKGHGDRLKRVTATGSLVHFIKQN